MHPLDKGGQGDSSDWMHTPLCPSIPKVGSGPPLRPSFPRRGWVENPLLKKEGWSFVALAKKGRGGPGRNAPPATPAPPYPTPPVPETTSRGYGTGPRDYGTGCAPPVPQTTPAPLLSKAGMGSKPPPRLRLNRK